MRSIKATITTERIQKMLPIVSIVAYSLLALCFRGLKTVVLLAIIYAIAFIIARKVRRKVKDLARFSARISCIGICIVFIGVIVSVLANEGIIVLLLAGVYSIVVSETIWKKAWKYLESEIGRGIPCPFPL